MFYGPNAPTLALNFYQICFTSIFHPEEMVLSKNFATSAHVRIFLAFKIYINFYSNLKIEPATPDLHLKFLKCTQCTKSCFLLFFELGNSDHYDHLCLVNFEREKVTRAHFWTTSAWSLFDPAIQICDKFQNNIFTLMPIPAR